MKKRAFTLIEAVIVLLITGIIATIVIPRFAGMAQTAKESAEKSVAGSVRQGITNRYSESIMFNTPAYPSQLDAASTGIAAPGNPVFTEVLQQGIARDWEKLAKVNNRDRYKGPTGSEYEYNQYLASQRKRFSDA